MTLFAVEEPLIYREEVTAVLIALADIVNDTHAIRRLLEDGEEEEEDVGE
jgi:hypothetical protein